MQRNILDYFPNGWTPSKLQAEVLTELELRWNSSQVFILKLDVASGKSAVATCIAKWVKSKGGHGAGARICTPTNVLVNQYTSLFPDLAVTKAPSQYRCETRQTTCGAYSAKMRCKGCVYNKDRNAAQKAPVSVSTYHMTKALYGSRKVMIFDEAHNLSKVIRDLYSTDVFAHKAEIPQYVVGDMDATHRWLLGLSASQLEEMHPVLQGFAKDLRSDSPLNFYSWSTKLWSGGGEAWGERLTRSEPEELPILEQQPLDIFTKPSPFWDANQKLVLMSATVGRQDLYELGLDRVRPIFIEGDPPITIDRNPIIKDYIGSISHSNIDKRVPEIATKILEYLNTRKGKGVIHVTYGLAEKLKPLLEHERLITHTVSNMRTKLKEFKESSNGVFMASGMYEGVSLDYDLARWQVIAKIVWPSLLDPLQKYRSSIDPDFYLWSTMKTVIQASGRVCRREDDFGETIVWDASFERLLKEGEHLVPKSFRRRIVE